MEILGYIAASLIGVSLGLIGGGGSILTVPILVYLFNIHAEQATSDSLFIVGATAAFGAYRHFNMGNLKIKSALFFTVPSVFSLLMVRKFILPNIKSHLFFIGNFDFTKNILIMIVFAILMIAASLSMIRPSEDLQSEHQTDFFRLAMIGFLVGLVTGFLGAGGGFLIIPALIFFAGLPMKEAVGTSLLIIFINSTIGFMGDVFNGFQVNFAFLFGITAIAVLGMFVGTAISKKTDGAKLKPAFGWFVLLMGLFIIGKEMFFKK